MPPGHKGFLHEERAGIIYSKLVTVETSTQGRGKVVGWLGWGLVTVYSAYCVSTQAKMCSYLTCEIRKKKTCTESLENLSKIRDNFSHEIKRCLLLGRKAMTNLDSILKNRDITLPTKVCLVKAMVFPVLRYGCESWAIKKAECQRIDAFEMRCWRRLLRIPWTIEIKPINPKGNCPEYSLEWLIWSWGCNTLATWSEEPTDWKRPWFCERLKAGGEGGNREWDGWMASPTQWAWVWANSGKWWTGKPGMLQFMGSQRVGHDLATEQKIRETLLFKDEAK